MDLSHVFAPQRTVNKSRVFWDPLGESIYQGKFSTDNTKLQKKYAYYLKHPKAPLRNLLLFLIPVFLLIGVIGYGPAREIFWDLISSGNDDNSEGIIILPFIPAVIYYWRVRRLQIDLIKMLLADKFGWAYSSQQNTSRWKLLKTRFSEIFEKGNQRQYVEDEFWGVFEGNPFWSALFHYEVRSGSGKSRTVRKYNRTVFCLQLRKIVAASFHIQKDSGMKFFRFFKGKSVDTESTEFNNQFDVYSSNKKVESPQKILEVLTPAVQMKLLELVRRNGKCEVLFKDDMVFFVFNGRPLKNMKTNFFKKVDISQKDQESLTHRFHDILDISDDIVPYLD